MHVKVADSSWELSPKLFCLLEQLKLNWIFSHFIDLLVKNESHCFEVFLALSRLLVFKEAVFYLCSANASILLFLSEFQLAFQNIFLFSDLEREKHFVQLAYHSCLEFLGVTEIQIF